MSEALTLLVGPSKKAFVVHKALLVNTCDSFKKATSGEWTESRSNVHTLDDVNVQVFEMFMRWLYTGVLHCLDVDDLDQLLVQAWALGDRLLSCRFKNVVMTALAKDWNRYIEGYPTSITVASMAYDLSLPNSKIRQLTKAKFSRHAQEEWRIDSASTINHDLLVDLCHEMFEIISEVRNSVRDPNDLEQEIGTDVCLLYHEHPDGYICSATHIKVSYRFHDSDEGLCDTNHPFETGAELSGWAGRFRC